MRNFLVAVLITLPFWLFAQSSILPQNLRCEYLVNPEGIDEKYPRFSWTLAPTNNKQFAQQQTAYKIIVSSSMQNVLAEKADCWNSGWVNSSDMSQVVYDGIPLQSDRKYYWRLAVKDEKGKIASWSKVNHWSTGLFSQSEWSASWIGSDEIQPADSKEIVISDPWFRKKISLKKKPAKATLFIASVGYHEIYVNGKKITDDVLAPAVSDHNWRARYVAYDLAPALQAGENVIGVWLGAGWSMFKSYFRDDRSPTPMFIAQADVYDNALQTSPSHRIVSDNSWKTHASPNRLLGSWKFGHFGGELWDANLEVPNWNRLNFSDNNWKNATVYNPSLKLTAQMVEPNKVFDEIHPIAVESRADGSYRIDMGVNFAGWTEIKVKGEPGQRVDFLFSERVENEITFDNRSAYIIGPSGVGVFKNRFNYGSGRWITVKGLKNKPLLSDCKGWLVRTAYTDRSTFTSSDSLQNWIYDKVKWTFENLSLGGYVVDCPQRERLGYGGDAHATSETGMYNYDLSAMYTKWMEDWRDVQGTRTMDSANYTGASSDDGFLPHTAPTYEGAGGPAWGGIVVTLPWTMYEMDGDKRVLEKNFVLIKKWLDFLQSHTKNNLLTRFGGWLDFLSDWLWPNATASKMNNYSEETVCFNNSYRVFNLRTAAKIARVIGKNEEAELWTSWADASAKAIHEKYYNAGDFSYSDSSLFNLSAALLADIPPPSVRPAVMKRVEREILEIRNGHIHVGITGGAMLFKLLRKEGRDDLLYSMTSQTAYPGWGFMKANDATTIWEMWEKNLPGHSLLHSSYLYPGAWYINGVSGIRKPADDVAYKHFVVRPPHINAQELKWANTSYNSPAGLIKTKWIRNNGNLQLTVTVPPGSTAEVHFPAKAETPIKVSSVWAKKAGYENGAQVFKLVAGEYVFSGKEAN
jgi:alpha-L-rhamnosidase